MSETEHVMTEFIRAWERGRRPDVDDYLARVAPEHRDELADQITTYLMVAPEPVYDEAAWAQLHADPVAGRLAAMRFDQHEPWPSLLPRLRERAGLTWHAVAERLSVSSPERAQAFLERMEQGNHDPNRVTVELLERLGRILGVGADVLAWRGQPAQPAPALYRAAKSAAAPAASLDMLAELALTPAATDDVDRLFLGGRGGE